MTIDGTSADGRTVDRSPPDRMPRGGHSLALSELLLQTAAVVRAVREGRSLTETLSGVPPAARGGTQALAFHALRRLGLTQQLRQGLSPRAPRPDVDALVLSALALLVDEPDEALYTDHTIVDQAVAATRRLQPGSAGFVNAVLRRFGRERGALLAQARQGAVARFNHPAWWIERLKHDWPDAWQALLLQAHRQPPMTLRVNLQHTTTQAYLERLRQAGLSAHALAPWPPGSPVEGQGDSASASAVVLDKPCPVTALPGFDDGDVSVQDAAAQRAAPLLLQGLPRGAGLRVLDACAAPGGKTAHLLEIDPSLRVTALDNDALRLERVRQNLQRLRLDADVRVGDARAPATWWDGEPFDAVLLDAPCSASGIVRRHPDIAWLRRPGDVPALAQLQAQLLDALWGVLKPGGVMLFATCSIFKAEGQDGADAFMQRPQASPPRLDAASPGHLLPLPDNPRATAVHDGFFYARFLKP